MEKKTDSDEATAGVCILSFIVWDFQLGITETDSMQTGDDQISGKVTVGE